jgi:hypothetical protein
MKLSNKYLIIGFLTLGGLIGGFLYWRFIGCSSGSCPITSNWYSSAFAGGLIGYFSGDSINDFRQKRASKQKTTL